jgi:hypothetical protein
MSENNQRLRDAWRLLNLSKDSLYGALRAEVKLFLEEPPPPEDENLARVREDQIVARKERDRIIKWFRVQYQLNRNAQQFADAIQRREHEMEYDAPAGVTVDGKAPMTGEEYDALVQKAALMRADRMTYGRKRVDFVFARLRQAVEEETPSLLTPVDLVILDDAVREMDRHLPDFFENIEEEDDDG